MIVPRQDWTEDELYMVKERAHSLALQGCYREAATLFQGLLALRPDDRYTRHALAALHIQLHDAPGALRLLDERPAPQDEEYPVRRLEALTALELREAAQRELAWLERHARNASSPAITRLALKLRTLQAKSSARSRS